jgi:hypothetical protein
MQRGLTSILCGREPVNRRWRFFFSIPAREKDFKNFAVNRPV